MNASIGWTEYDIADVPGSVASPTDVSEGMRVEGDDGGWLTAMDSQRPRPRSMAPQRRC